MFCVICGQELPEGTQFCTSCSAKNFLSDNVPENTVARPPQAEEKPLTYKIPRVEQAPAESGYYGSFQSSKHPPKMKGDAKVTVNANAFALVGFILGLVAIPMEYLYGVFGTGAIIFSAIALAGFKNLNIPCKIFSIVGIAAGICNVYFALEPVSSLSSAFQLLC